MLEAVTEEKLRAALERILSQHKGSRALVRPKDLCKEMGVYWCPTMVQRIKSMLKHVHVEGWSYRGPYRGCMMVYLVFERQVPLQERLQHFAKWGRLTSMPMNVKRGSSV